MNKLKRMCIGVGLVWVAAVSCARRPEPESASSPAEKEAPERTGVPVAAPAGAVSEDESLREESAGQADTSAAPAPVPPAAPVENERMQTVTPELQLEEAWQQLQLDYSGLTQAMQLQAPNCDQADTFRRRVCDLSERICKLEEESVSSAKRHCEDGRQRCADASRQYERRCSR